MSEGGVMIVDDDPVLLEALPEALRLRMQGVRVETADSAAAALVCIANRDYDAIVTDIPGTTRDVVSDAGYRYVETVGSHLDDAATVRSKLDARGLKVSSSHVSLAALREKPDAVAEACQTLGFTDLYMPAVPPDDRDMAADGWRALGLELGKIADTMKGKGIDFGYHNHHWELKPKDGSKTALELIFEAADGSAK